MYHNKKALLKDDSTMPHKQKLFKNMLKRIQSRGEAFYKFGLRSYEKYDEITFLEDILNVLVYIQLA